MLGIGIDWAEEFHDIAFGTQEKGVIEQFRINHGPAGVTALIERARALEPDPAEVRGHTVKDPDPGKAFPGGEIYLSMPGLGDVLAARIAGEIGEHIGQFDHPNGLQCYAGSAPVTRRSGKSDFVVARRLAHNHYLGAAVHQWAFCSLLHSGWAREFYDGKKAAGKTHHAALRALSNRWLEILWHCLTKDVLYDENVHVANRNRALGRAA